MPAGYDCLCERCFGDLLNAGKIITTDDPTWNPDKMGWFPEKINSSLDAVILGMQAKKYNPEVSLSLARVKATFIDLSILAWAPVINTPSGRWDLLHSVIPATNTLSLSPFGSAPSL